MTSQNPNNSVQFSTEYLVTVTISYDQLLTNHLVNNTLDVSENNFSTYYNETLMNTTVNNATLFDEEWKKVWKPILDYLMLLVLIIIMLAMGCDITWKELFGIAKRPVGLCIGMVSQFGILPLSAYTVLTSAGIDGLHATGFLIISCCPSGVLSNTFAYFCDGDVSLSVAMTSASTLMGMGMMPLNIWLYGRHFETDNVVIPYRKMATSMVTVTAPVVIGMLIRYKFRSAATWITKIGSYFGITLLFSCFIIEIFLFPNMFTDMPTIMYPLIIALHVAGLSLGYGLATILKQSEPVRKTVAIECGVQNVPLALTVITLSFSIEMQQVIVLLPWLYGFAMVTGCSVFCAIYNIRKRLRLAKIENNLTESELHKVSSLEVEETLLENEKVAKIVKSGVQKIEFKIFSR